VYYCFETQNDGNTVECQIYYLKKFYNMATGHKGKSSFKLKKTLILGS